MTVTANNIKYDQIVMVGAGGTGGYIIPHVIRMLSHLQPVRTIPITIVDPDHVEVKNCNRQNFTPMDVGKSKAQVLAERYSAAFGYPVKYVIDKYQEHQINVYQSCLLIDTIDNIEGRLYIDKVYKRVYNNVNGWISVGNTESTGQLVYADRKNPINQTVVDLFPETFNEDRAVEERQEIERRSCADHVVSNPQSLAINLLGATLCLQLLYEIFYEQKASYHTVLYDRFNSIKRWDFAAPFYKILTNAEKRDLTMALASVGV